LRNSLHYGLRGGLRLRLHELHRYLHLGVHVRVCGGLHRNLFWNLHCGMHVLLQRDMLESLRLGLQRDVLEHLFGLLLLDLLRPGVVNVEPRQRSVTHQRTVRGFGWLDMAVCIRQTID